MVGSLLRLDFSVLSLAADSAELLFGCNLFESIAFKWMCESLSVAVIEITTAFKSSWLPFLL